jgi:SCY1-like protein 2
MVRFILSRFLCSDNVQMATLSVQEAMGVKVDREAVATLVLPQLWTMSMGPCV